MTKTGTNALGQPIGINVPGWIPRELPSREPMQGRYCRIEPLDVDKHIDGIWAGVQLDPEGRNWTYSPPNKPDTIDGLRELLEANAASKDPFHHAIVDLTEVEAVGWATFMDMQPETGSMEVGYIHYTPRLQRKPTGTEAMYLMMRRAFDELAYRRYAWRCHSLNGPSNAAAKRLGFTYEGTHRQSIVMNGRNRDTSWYSILESEWPAIKAAFEAWLDPSNFDSNGNQRRSLAEHREADN